MSQHCCFHAGVLVVPFNDDCRFLCDHCSETFPTYQGLSNHATQHRTREAQDKYENERRDKRLEVVNRSRPLSGEVDLNLSHVYVEMANASRLPFPDECDPSISGGIKPIAVTLCNGFVDLRIPCTNDPTNCDALSLSDELVAVGAVLNIGDVLPLSNTNLGDEESEVRNCTDNFDLFDGGAVESMCDRVEDNNVLHVSSTELHLETSECGYVSDPKNNDFCDLDCKSGPPVRRNCANIEVGTVSANTIPKTVYTLSPPCQQISFRSNGLVASVSEAPFLTYTNDFSPSLQEPRNLTGGIERSPGLYLNSNPPIQDMVLTSFAVNHVGLGGWGFQLP